MRILSSFIFECMRIQSSFTCVCMCMWGYLHMHAGLFYVCMYDPKHIYIYTHTHTQPAGHHPEANKHKPLHAAVRKQQCFTIYASRRTRSNHILTPTNTYTNTQANMCTDIYMCSRHSCHTRIAQHTHISQRAYQYQTLEINIWGGYDK